MGSGHLRSTTNTTSLFPTRSTDTRWEPKTKIYNTIRTAHSQFMYRPTSHPRSNTQTGCQHPQARTSPCTCGPTGLGSRSPTVPGHHRPWYLSLPARSGSRRQDLAVAPKPEGRGKGKYVSLPSASSRSAAISLRTICSGLCRFLVAMILSSLPAHNVGRKTLTHPRTNQPGSGQGLKCVVVISPRRSVRPPSAGGGQGARSWAGPK